MSDRQFSPPIPDLVDLGPQGRSQVEMEISHLGYDPRPSVDEIGSIAVDLTELLKPRCGIYFLCQGDVVVYVGQSKKIAARLLSHLSEGRKQFDRALFIEVAPSDLDSLELQYMRDLTPFYNTPRDLLRMETLVAKKQREAA